MPEIDWLELKQITRTLFEGEIWSDWPIPASGPLTIFQKGVVAASPLRYRRLILVIFEPAENSLRVARKLSVSSNTLHTAQVSCTPSAPTRFRNISAVLSAGRHRVNMGTRWTACCGTRTIKDFLVPGSRGLNLSS